jgi:hypothetical protein
VATRHLSNELKEILEEICSLGHRIQETELMVDAYRRSYDVAGEKYSSGLLDVYALNLAKNNYTKAQLELNKFMVEYSMNLYLLKFYEEGSGRGGFLGKGEGSNKW